MLTHEIIEYIDAAVRTEKVPWFQFTNEIRAPEGQVILQQPTFKGVVGELKVRLLHSGLGMMTEISELQAALEKRDWVNVGEEVGDVLWYWAVAMHALQFGNLPARAPATTYMLAEARTGRPLIAAICTWGDLVRKDAIHSKAMKPEDALAALSDVLDEACTLCEAVSISPLQVMRRNIAKLRVRFPDKYDGVRFDQRDLEAERAVLERVHAVEPVEAAMNVLLSQSPAQRDTLRTWHSGIACYCVTVCDVAVFVAATDLAERCICVGLPAAPATPGYCPRHPER